MDSLPTLTGVVVAGTSSKGRTFGQAKSSVFSRLDDMVEPQLPRYQVHSSAKEIWGRNLDGVDPDATKAAMDQDVVANKEEAESLLQMGTRTPKTLTEVKEARRKMAAELKSAHPGVFTDDSKTHLPATVMPDGEFTSAAAAKKIGTTNPYGPGAKTLDPFLKTLAEGHEIRRQIIEVNSSETYYAFDELLAAIKGGASGEQLTDIVVRLRDGVQMTEVIAQEIIMLPTAAVSTKFIDLAKQKEAQNRGNPVSNAAMSIATAAGITVNVSSGSQNYLGSGSSNTSKDKVDVQKPAKKSMAKPQSPHRKPSAERRGDKRKRERQDKDRARTGAARESDSSPAATGGGATPDKQTGGVPGSKSPNASPGTDRRKQSPRTKQPPSKGKGGGRK